MPYRENIHETLATLTQLVGDCGIVGDRLPRRLARNTLDGHSPLWPFHDRQRFNRRSRNYLVRDIMYCKPGKVRPMVEKFLAMAKLMEEKGMGGCAFSPT